ncbi:MAG: TetR/AcrR family transcriptional regulator [Phenylobacterium sp.]|uniref:TetR/AcrR family transcriptional regulator n=1 Tax=Phenylobacterium sp. TaxID=1871053 RepID=UPI001B77D85C|nr:TetR/AcrR family transcriptional regulator [Phenylobacterium sp.]MBP7650058.1 TetR/AcrR family transcriptional regulator [Phenylobacterium sp.]MBP7814632.1 TetR/AcrR family transcriptional regulator [Phenylobacterium sp.]MBP9232850.1 TetR/AcrR family transcriptional regulator [Phenylobacterium sp.]MBP9756748.1 TetR/AcrR family transcriptional regulator [Phenylobacterium sp.]
MTEETRRRPKGDKRARTRAALMEAARQLAREKGYEATTMEEVARRAGMTSGAIYGNFKNRQDLFMAIAQTDWAPIKPVIAPGASFPQILRAFAEATLAALPVRQPAAPARLSGMAHTLRHEEARAQVREITGESYAGGAAWLAGILKDGDSPMPPEILVVVIHALTEGLLFQRFMTPDLVPDEVFYSAFAALAAPPR